VRQTVRADIIGEDRDILVRHTHDVEAAWETAAAEIEREELILSREDYVPRAQYARVSPTLPHQHWADFAWWVYPTDEPGRGAFRCVYFRRKY
jgi:hypothetical protein